MKVLFLITRYDVRDGASRALYAIIKNNIALTKCKVLCKIKWQVQEDLDVKVVTNGKEIVNEYISGGYDLIHNFKAGGYDAFYWLQKEIRNEKIYIPIVTTVCQRPSFKKMLLRPDEIRYSTILVFIDKASYKDSLFNFIPNSKKEFTYFGATKDLIEKTDHLSQCYTPTTDCIVYGRGSTQSKCPRNMINVYDLIDVEHKKFVVAGCDKCKTWLHELVSGRSDIQLYGQLPYEEWLELCATFDVFLYQIPEDTHSSIDGVLSQAMLMRKPVVYYGSEAPKERFIHGYNGFIANTYAEIAYYATLLGKDPAKRKEIGRNARKTTIEQFSIMSTVSNYNRIYQKTLSMKEYIGNSIYIPGKYRRYYLYCAWRTLLKLYFKGTFVEKIYRKVKPLKPNY